MGAFLAYLIVWGFRYPMGISLLLAYAFERESKNGVAFWNSRL